MAKIKTKYPGVYLVEGKTGVSYGIDYIHPITGERIRKILKGCNAVLKAVELRSIQIADAARGAINQAYGLKSKIKTVSFEDMVDVYLKWSRENKESWATDEYRAKPIKEVFKGKLMSDINPFMVEKYKMFRAKTVTKATVNKELVFGSQVFTKSIEWKKYYGENPFIKANRFKIKKKKKPGSLLPEQVRAIRDEISHEVKRDMVDFAYYTGWRISEIRNLKKEDVKLEKGTAWIIDPKNTETVEIVLSDEAIKIISRQNSPGAYVFCHKNGKPFNTNLHKVIKNAARRAGVVLPPRKAWHIFRRTWASMFQQHGGDVETMRVQGNWKDYSMPMWYADAGNTEYRKEILNRIPKLNEAGNDKIDGRNMAEMGNVEKLCA